MRLKKYKILFLLTYVIFLFLVLEAGSFFIIKLKYPFYVKNTLTNRQLSGYYLFKNTQNYKYPYVFRTEEKQEALITDKFGFIKDFDSYQKSEETIRVFLCGGSTAIGAGQTGGYEKAEAYPKDIYAYEISIAGFLKSELEKKYPQKKIQVVNAASYNRSMHQSYLLYLESISFLQPDFVVTLDGYNDNTVLENEKLDPFNYYEDVWLDQYTALKGISRSKFRSDFLTLIKLTLMRDLKKRKKPSESDQKNNEVKEENLMCVNIDTVGYESYEDSLLQSRFIVNQRWLQILEYFQYSTQFDNAEFIYVWQPILESRRNKSLSKNETKLLKFIQAKYKRPKFQFCLDQMTFEKKIDSMSLNWQENDTLKLKELPFDFFIDKKRLYPEKIYSDVVAKRIEEQVQLLNGVFIDANTEIQGLNSSFEFYTDYCHLTVEANREIAKIIAREIYYNDSLNRINM